ncbi:MMPL family transporter [Streptomyces otsuchiensis]|uniref:MMPL family transporter n=1 Tax=Streptomyces otsuchiensis TaxID=2681388 RepID=UPI001031B417|nr:MMPL family transporter [Streptomyces otsuchiensis]
MATFLYKLGRASFLRRRLVALIWVLLLGVTGVAAATTASQPSNEISMPGTEAQEAFDLLSERYPGMGADGATARVVFRAEDGTIDDQANQQAVSDVVRELGESSDEVASVTDPFESGAVSQDGSTAYTQVSYLVSGFQLDDADRDALEAAAQSGRDAGLTVEIGGDALFEVPATGIAEIIGIAVAAVVLVVTLGSLVAAGLPLITALVGVGVAVLTITVLSGPLELDATTPILAMMLGLAVGIDYALFIVSRYRAELAAGHSKLDAVGRASGTAGSAVIFAGLTVIIAMAGLAVVNIPILTKMGLAAAGAVTVAVVIAVTLIPAVLGFAGDRARSRRDITPSGATDGDRSGEGAGDESAAERPNMGTRWARQIIRRPVAVLLAGVVGLGVIAIPASQLELNLPDDGSSPTSTTQRQAYDLLAESFGPGFNGPLLVVLDGADGGDAMRAAEELTETMNGMEQVVAVTPPQPDEAGDTALLTVIPVSTPSSAETEGVVNDIRAQADALQESAGVQLSVTGQTAMGIDVSQKIDDALVPYLALVVSLAFLLLMLVFRSILVPLKAALGFLLSVLAALGAVVAVFQWGWLAGVLGVETTGPVMSLMPIFLIGVVFGLAMDYEVFLVTRMREAYVHGASPDEAIVTGFKYGARVVTAAAIIMISVFAGFVSATEPMIKMIGFGLAVAVLFDAFVVRMAIIPALLAILGKSAWWLPAWLDRVLPNVDVEGERLAVAGTPTGSPATAEPAADGEGEAGTAPGKDAELPEHADRRR